MAPSGNLPQRAHLAGEALVSDVTLNRYKERLEAASARRESDARIIERLRAALAAEKHAKPDKVSPDVSGLEAKLEVARSTNTKLKAALTIAKAENKQLALRLMQQGAMDRRATKQAKDLRAATKQIREDGEARLKQMARKVEQAQARADELHEANAALRAANADLVEELAATEHLPAITRERDSLRKQVKQLEGSLQQTRDSLFQLKQMVRKGEHNS